MKSGGEHQRGASMNHPITPRPSDAVTPLFLNASARFFIAIAPIASLAALIQLLFFLLQFFFEGLNLFPACL
jgi:hypothetical protein